MKKLSIALFMFMAFSAFAGNHENLVGDWSFNVEKFKASDEYKEALKDPQAGQMMPFILNMFSKMKFTFTKTEAVANIPSPDGNNKVEKATYTVVADTGNTLEVKTKGAEDKEETMVITFIDAKNIKMEPKGKQSGPMGSIYLIKK